MKLTPVGILLEARQKAFQEFLDATENEKGKRFQAWNQVRHAIEHIENASVVIIVGRISITPKVKRPAAVAHEIMQGIMAEAVREKNRRRFA